MPEEYTTRELGIVLTNIIDKLDTIDKKVSYTNGKIADIEKWRLENKDFIEEVKEKKDSYRTCFDWVKNQIENNKTIRTSFLNNVVNYIFKSLVIVLSAAVTWLWIIKDNV